MLVLAAQKADRDGFISRIIAMRSGLPGMLYSHVEFYWSTTGRAFVIHPSARSGAVLGMAWVDRTYDDNRWDYYFPPVSEEESKLLERRCDSILEAERIAAGGKPRYVYDWPGIVQIATLGLSGSQEAKWWFCSEFIADSFLWLGYREVFPLRPESYSPALACYAVLQWQKQPELVRLLWSDYAAHRRSAA